MGDKSRYCFFQGTRLPNFDSPIAVVTFQQERPDFFFTEYFVFQFKQPGVLACRIRCSNGAEDYLALRGPDDLISDTAEHAARELEGSKIDKLPLQQQTWWALNVKFEFTKTDTNPLITAWYRGQLHAEMAEMRRITRSIGLRHELDRIFALPKIQWTEERPPEPPPF